MYEEYFYKGNDGIPFVTMFGRLIGDSTYQETRTYI